jgi:hypothetical protein
MKNIREQLQVSTIEELDNLIQNYFLSDLKFYGYHKSFRGQASLDYKLQTRIAANYGDPILLQQKANQIFNLFRSTINEAHLQNEFYLPKDLNLGIYDKVYYLLAQAQHIGIPTSFMDWTFNWRSALYFVIEDFSRLDKSGQIWVMLRPIEDEDHVFGLNPFLLEEPKFVNPYYDQDADFKKFLGEKRRHNQAGQFLIMPFNDNVIPLEENNSLQWPLFLIEILPSLKQQVHELINKPATDQTIELMQELRLDFKTYNDQIIYGTMNDDLKSAVNTVRKAFGFADL